MLVSVPSPTLVGGVALLAILASSLSSRGETAVAPVTVTITDKGCEPAAVTVNAGKSLFKVKNSSRRAV